jgi:hypothetical protein
MHEDNDADTDKDPRAEPNQRSDLISVRECNRRHEEMGQNIYRRIDDILRSGCSRGQNTDRALKESIDAFNRDMDRLNQDFRDKLHQFREEWKSDFQGIETPIVTFTELEQLNKRRMDEILILLHDMIENVGSMRTEFAARARAEREFMDDQKAEAKAHEQEVEKMIKASEPTVKKSLVHGVIGAIPIAVIITIAVWIAGTNIATTTKSFETVMNNNTERFKEQIAMATANMRDLVRAEIKAAGRR